MPYEIYNELTDWYSFISPLKEYEEEAVYYHQLIREHTDRMPSKMLELGSGAGHNAFYLKQWYKLTLTDLSERMLDLSRQLNPECDHIQGDMRYLRLGRTFEVVFMHDAIMYMASQTDLEMAIQTAFIHCAEGGIVLITPDFVKENFKEQTDTGGSSNEKGSLHYLEWSWGPNEKGKYFTDFVFAYRNTDEKLTVHTERHEWGLFSTEAWLQLLAATGFDAVSFADPFGRICFMGKRNSEEIAV